LGSPATITLAVLAYRRRTTLFAKGNTKYHWQSGHVRLR
jgi:hypothetical protein